MKPCHDALGETGTPAPARRFLPGTPPYQAVRPTTALSGRSGCSGCPRSSPPRPGAGALRGSHCGDRQGTRLQLHACSLGKPPQVDRGAAEEQHLPIQPQRASRACIVPRNHRASSCRPVTRKVNRYGRSRRLPSIAAKVVSADTVSRVPAALRCSKPTHEHDGRSCRHRPHAAPKAPPPSPAGGSCGHSRSSYVPTLRVGIVTLKPCAVHLTPTSARPVTRHVAEQGRARLTGA